MSIKQYIVTLLLLFSSLLTVGQMSHSLYVFDNLPQNNFENPALINNAEWTLSLPILAGVSANFYSPVTFNQLGSITQDSILNLNLKNLQKKTPSVFSINQTLDIPLFTYTRSKDKHQFSFALYERQNFSIYANSELLNLINNGNSNINQIQQPKAGFNFTSYHEFSAGFAKRKNRKLTLGARAKLLLGTYNFQTRKSEIAIKTESDLTAQDFAVQAVYEYNDSILPITKESFISNFISPKNIGFAFDYGFHYHIDRKSKISASINNVGFIRWNTQSINYTAIGDYTWKGIDLDQVINHQKDFNEIIEETKTSIQKSIGDTITYSAYYTLVNPNVLLHYTQKIAPQLEMSMINRTTLFYNHIKNNLSIVAKYQINKHTAVSSSYSIINRSFINLGIAVYSNHRKFDWYMGTNNFLWFLSSSNFKAANLTFGCNLKLQNVIDPLYLSWEKKRKMSLKRQQNWYELE